MIRNEQNQTLICNQVTLEGPGIDQFNFTSSLRWATEPLRHGVLYGNTLATNKNNIVLV